MPGVVTQGSSLPPVQDCIDCFPHKTEIPRASWDAFETQVEALLAIRGQQRGRMEAQYTQFKRHAAEWRERVHDGSHALSDERERAESECEAASARASEAQSRRSGSVRGAARLAPALTGALLTEWWCARAELARAL